MEGRHGDDMGEGGGSPVRALGVWLEESLIIGVDSYAPPPNLVMRRRRQTTMTSWA